MLKRVCNILINIILVILILLAGVLFVPNLIGYKSFAVISGSMEPTYPVGSIVYAKETPFDELKVGDAISFDISGENKVTHRIVAIDKEKQQFTTKGDANNVEDGNPVSYQNVIGKVVFSLPLLGYLSLYVQSPLGIAIAAGVIFVILLLNFLPEIFSKDKEEIKKK